MTSRPTPGERPLSPKRRPTPPTGKRDPERTRRNLLDAAYHEFAARGFQGTTIDLICRRAGVSKQILSHHFGSKKGIHMAVLRHTYATARRQDLTTSAKSLSPEEAIRTYVGATFDYLDRNRAFVALQADENINHGRHMRELPGLDSMYSPLIGWLQDVLRAGEQAGAFRPGIDPRQLYISIAAQSYFYFSNRYTLSAAFETDLMAPGAIAARRAHVVDLICNALRRTPDQPATPPAMVDNAPAPAQT